MTNSLTSTMTSLAAAITVLLTINVNLLVSSFQDKSKDQRQQQHSNDDDNESNDNEQCNQVHERCHSDRECCLGYICSTATDEQIHHGAVGSESSGVCVEDVTSFSCQTDDQCGDGSHCIGSDSTGQGHCQTRGTVYAEGGDQHETLHMYRKRRGGLGSSCETTADCNAYTMDGLDELCCQDVRRGRQGTKRMCDRSTPISHCIN